MKLLSKFPVFGWFFSASFLIFVSSNFVNLGNLLFNLLFSRWMGPALFSDLALLLTLMLTIMGVLNAVQFLVTERVAEVDEVIRREYIGQYAKISKVSMITLFFALPLIGLLTIGLHIGDWLGLQNVNALLLFYLGVPFYLPLALWRGVAQGRVDVWRILSTNNAEMFVRLVGGAILWWLGLGIMGVIFALVLSIIIATYFAKPIIPNAFVLPPASMQRALPMKKAWPWAAMQLSVVLALDGDVFVAKVILTAEEAGLVAAVSLVQRIIFFASFALSAVLLPQTIEAIKRGENGLKQSWPIIGLILSSALVIILALQFWPDLIVKILFGNAFLPVSEVIARAAISATLVTLSYFIVVFLLAHKKLFSAYLFLGIACTQLFVMAIWVRNFGGGLEKIVELKLYVQTGAFIAFALVLCTVLLRFQRRMRQ